MSKREPPARVRLAEENLSNWPSYQKLCDEGKLKFDGEGRLRYLHGAPVGDLVLSGTNKDGQAIYRESANEWFDPESEAAESFEWK